MRGTVRPNVVLAVLAALSLGACAALGPSSKTSGTKAPTSPAAPAKPPADEAAALIADADRRAARQAAEEAAAQRRLADELAAAVPAGAASATAPDATKAEAPAAPPLARAAISAPVVPPTPPVARHAETKPGPPERPSNARGMERRPIARSAAPSEARKAPDIDLAREAKPGGAPIEVAGGSRPSDAGERAGGAGERMGAAPEDLPPPDARKVGLARWTPTRGHDGAKVTIVVFSDFECPFCRRLLPTLEALRERYGDELRIAFRHYPLPFHSHARLAAEAAMAAAAQGRFWEMHDLLFEHQDALEPEDLEHYAEQAQLNLRRFKADMASHRYRSAVMADAREAEGFDVHGTPTCFVNGRPVLGAQSEEVFQEAIEAEMRRADRLLSAGTPRAKLLDEALAEIRAPAAEEPERVEIRLPEGAPSRGRRNAPVTIVEFADFQCRFCARVSPTLRELERKYKGKLRRVFLNLPLPFHPDAQLAAEAVMAAELQNRFWEMHDQLFEHADALSREDLERYAQAAGLEMKLFRQALDEGTMGERVQRDQAEAERLGVRATPSFFVNGVALVGAQPPSKFEQLIDAELSRVARATAGPGKGRKARKSAR